MRFHYTHTYIWFQLKSSLLNQWNEFHAKTKKRSILRVDLLLQNSVKVSSSVNISIAREMVHAIINYGTMDFASVSFYLVSVITRKLEWSKWLYLNSRENVPSISHRKFQFLYKCIVIRKIEMRFKVESHINTLPIHCTSWNCQCHQILEP